MGKRNLIIKAELEDRVIEFWDDVDRNWGRNAHLFYEETGVFTTTEHELRGRDAIKNFYSWREGRGERVARHVISNFNVSVDDEDVVQSRWIMSLYAADGGPVLPSEPPILLADVVDVSARGADGIWLYRSRILVPLFKGKTPTTNPPKT